MLKFSIFKQLGRLFLLAGLCVSSACSPTYNWREINGPDARFVVLMPNKPVSMSRSIVLNDQPVTMTMTAAEVEGVSFAVGYASLPDAGQVPAALTAMKAALVNNIHGRVKFDREWIPQSNNRVEQENATDMEAIGFRDTSGGSESVRLLGHFAAKGKYVYQVIVLGSEKGLRREEASTFLSSFNLK